MPSRHVRRRASEDVRRGSSGFGSEDHIKETGRESYNTTNTNRMSQKPQKRRSPMGRFRRSKIPDSFTGP